MQSATVLGLYAGVGMMLVWMGISIARIIRHKATLADLKSKAYDAATKYCHKCHSTNLKIYQRVYTTGMFKKDYSGTTTTVDPQKKVQHYVQCGACCSRQFDFEEEAPLRDSERTIEPKELSLTQISTSDFRSVAYRYADKNDSSTDGCMGTAHLFFAMLMFAFFLFLLQFV